MYALVNAIHEGQNNIVYLHKADE